MNNNNMSRVARSIGKGEVVGSIPSRSTRKDQQRQHLAPGPLPCIPRFVRERTGKVPRFVGDSWDTLFANRSPPSAVSCLIATCLAADAAFAIAMIVGAVLR